MELFGGHGATPWVLFNVGLAICLAVDFGLAAGRNRAIGIKEVVTHLTTFAELLPGVAAGRWTLNVPLFVTPQRAALVSVSRPVWALQD